MISNVLRRGIIILLVMGVVVSIIAAFMPFFTPGDRFHISKIDLLWLVGFGVLILTISLLVFFRKKRLILGLCCLYIILLVSYILILQPFRYTFFLACVFFVLAPFVGDALLIPLHRSFNLPFLDRIAVSWIVGLASYSLVTTALNFAGKYFSPYTELVILFIFSVAVWRIFIRFRLLNRCKQHLTRLLVRDDHSIGAWALAMLLIAGTGAFFWIVAPPIRYDSISYHIPVPLAYLENGGMVAMPESIQTYWAHYAEMLPAFLYPLLPDGSVSNYFHYFSGILLTFLVFILARKMAGSTAGWIAALFFWSLPIVQKEAGSAYVDLFVALTYAGAVLMVWNWVEKPGDWRLLVLCGFLSGITLGTKITTGPLVLIIFLTIIGFFLVNRSRQPGKLWHSLIGFGVPTFLTAFPWLLRDFIWTGNPIFPILNSIFQSDQWYQANNIFINNNNKFTDILLYPFELVWNSKKYYHEAEGGALVALPMLIFPWFLAFRPGQVLFRNKAPTYLFGFIYISMLLFIWMTTNARYLMPLYPFFASLAAVNVWAVLGRSNAFVNNRLWLSIAGIYLLAAQAGMLNAHWNFPERYPLALFLGRQSREEFLISNLPVYSGLRFLDQTGDGKHKVLSLGNEFRLYTRSKIFGPMFSMEAQEILRSATAQDLAANLRKNGYEYLLIYLPEQEFRGEIYTSPGLNHHFFQCCTEIVFAQADTLVFQLFPTNPVYSPNSLSNPGYESLNLDKNLLDWGVIGLPRWTDNTLEVRSGNRAVQISGPSIDAVTQDVPVRSGSIYTLGTWALPDEANPSTTIQLIIDWYSPDGTVISTSRFARGMTRGWNWYQFTNTAPQNTGFARITISLGSPNSAIIDDACFSTSTTCWKN